MLFRFSLPDGYETTETGSHGFGMTVFIHNTHTHTKPKSTRCILICWTGNKRPRCMTRQPLRFTCKRTQRKKKSDIVVLVFFLEHHEFCFWPRGLSRGLSLRRSGFVIPAASGLVRQLQVKKYREAEFYVVHTVS